MRGRWVRSSRCTHLLVPPHLSQGPFSGILIRGENVHTRLMRICPVKHAKFRFQSFLGASLTARVCICVCVRARVYSTRAEGLCVQSKQVLVSVTLRWWTMIRWLMSSCSRFLRRWARGGRLCDVVSIPTRPWKISIKVFPIVRLPFEIAHCARGRSKEWAREGVEVGGG